LEPVVSGLEAVMTFTCKIVVLIHYHLAFGIASGKIVV
jgi:hypothetical protein